nr:hypothetical protein [uncultured Desulfobacter sp.]
MTQKFRRKYLVDLPYQFTQAGLVLLANLLVMIFIAFLLSWYYLIASDSTLVVNYNHQVPVLISCAIFIVCLSSTFFSLRRSRSTAGMMMILRQILTNAAKGVFPKRPVLFRHSDYSGFRNLADPLNDCLICMQATVEHKAATRTAVDKLKQLIEQTRPDNLGPGTGQNQLHQELTRLLHLLDQESDQ